MQTPSSRLAWFRFLTAVALVYSVLHFVRSGIQQPFDHPNLGKFEEHLPPLREHLLTGEPVHWHHPAQYGPVFFLVMQPLIRGTTDATLERALYAIQLLCVAAGFLLTMATLRHALAISTSAKPWVVAWLAVIWLNFSPLYTILAMKSVEVWELALIALALYAYVRRWRWVAGTAIVAAGLVKILPFAFLYYWLVTDRRTLLRALAALGVLLLISHALYGPEMGLQYLPRVMSQAGGDSYGLLWHENVSLKAALARLFGELPAPSHDAARTSGYVITLLGWRKTAAVVLGDICALVGVAALAWTWTQGRPQRSADRIVWDWSLLAVAVLILAPNTAFEYLTLSLGAVSYAFARLWRDRRQRVTDWAYFLVSLILMGGLLPRQVLNRITLVAVLNRWSGHSYLALSEGYQYYCFPLIGLLLLVVTLARLTPATDVGTAARSLVVRDEYAR